MTVEGTDAMQASGSTLNTAWQVGVPCKFPFSVSIGFFSFGPYDACADPGDLLGMDLSGYLFCATSVDGSGNALSYGWCDPNCLSGK